MQTNELADVFRMLMERLASLEDHLRDVEDRWGAIVSRAMDDKLESVHGLPNLEILTKEQLNMNMRLYQRLYVARQMRDAASKGEGGCAFSLHDRSMDDETVQDLKGKGFGVWQYDDISNYAVTWSDTWKDRLRQDWRAV